MQLPSFDKETKTTAAPHVVILGAGASKAATPQGDRSGQTLPLMNDMVKIVGIDSLLEGACIDWEGRNFEDLYEDIAHDPRQSVLVAEVERRIREFFSRLEIPDTPTVYDHLLLSLRRKDMVASFNWDPFLAQSWKRLAQYFKEHYMPLSLPAIVFLHGNVAIGVCEEHKVQNFVENKCSRCDSPLTPTRLLYPISQKNYSTDPLINSEWSRFQNYLEHAFLVTVLGYSAPKTDVEARKAMRAAWSQNPSLQLAEIEIIDIRNQDEVHQEWQDLIFSHHYSYKNRFDDSCAGRFPRRSCEALYRIYLEAEIISPREFGKEIPLSGNLPDLMEWVRPFVFQEQDWPDICH